MWGLRHTLHFAHTFEPILGGSALLAGAVAPLSIAPPFLPVAGCLPDGDTRATLPGFPRPGDNFGVDASTAGWNAQDWSYGSGPVQRLIVRLEAGKVKGEVILPGGQSGFPGSPFWADQARLWLGNQRHPIHFAVDEVKQNAVQRWVFQNSN